MAYSLIASVQGSGATTNNDTFTTGAIDTTGATLLVANVVQFEGTSATLTDSKGNTWNGLTARAALGQTRLFYATNVVVGSGHTFTLTGTDIWGLIQVQAWSGSHLTAPFDQEAGNTSGSGTSKQPGSITPSEDNCLVVSAIALELNTVGTLSINSSFTITHQKDFENPVNTPGGLAYLVQTTAAAVNPTWSWTGTRTAGVGIASFKAAAADALGAAAHHHYAMMMRR